jgi:AraC-like DNA-binding protein
MASLVTANGGIARAAHLRALNANIDVNSSLKKAGLTSSQLRKPDVRLAVRSQIKFLNAISEQLDDDFLGIHLAQTVDLRELGLTYYALASSENFQDALKRLARYSAIHNEGVRIDVSIGRRIAISFEYVGISRAGDRHQIEFFVAILVRLCRRLTGKNLSPLGVRLAHRRTATPVDLRTFFGCAVEFGAPVDQVTYAGDIKSAVLPNADPFLNRLLQGYCDEILSHRGTKSNNWRVSVENAMAPLLPHGEATIENVAQRLGVGRRTLARRLSQERASFADVLQELRRAMADQLFREPQMSIAEVAWLLGYRDSSAFSHAYKRWTGRSPRAVRAKDRPS